MCKGKGELGNIFTWWHHSCPSRFWRSNHSSAAAAHQHRGAGAFRQDRVEGTFLSLASVRLQSNFNFASIRTEPIWSMIFFLINTLQSVSISPQQRQLQKHFLLSKNLRKSTGWALEMKSLFLGIFTILIQIIVIVRGSTHLNIWCCSWQIVFMAFV